jgi:hypothetical protein
MIMIIIEIVHYNIWVLYLPTCLFYTWQRAIFFIYTHNNIDILSVELWLVNISYNMLFIMFQNVDNSIV